MERLENIRQQTELWGPLYTCGVFIDKIFRWDLIGSFQDNILKNMTIDEYRKKIEKKYRQKTGKILNLDSPISFNQKIQWIKLYDTVPLKTMLADKYLVREWIREKIGEKYLVSLLGVWDSFDQIEFKRLPNSFFLKCNHGYGFNLGVQDKNKMDIVGAKHIFDHWMQCNFAFYGLELQYRDIKRKIIAEEYIKQSDGNLLDYKIHVFHGEPKIIEVIGNRNLIKKTAKECFMSIDWLPQSIKYYNFEEYDYVPKRPNNFDEMLEIARILGKDFRYVRVDLYNTDGKILFGEMSFTPSAGYGKEEDQILDGSWIHLE